MVAVTSLTHAAEDSTAQASSILNRMSDAVRTLSYDGVFVSIRGGDVASLRIIHSGAGPDGERERLISLNGLPKEVIRKGREVTCISPGDRSVMVDKSHPHQLLATALPQPVEKISEFYSFTVLGGDRIAGRPTWVVGIQPKEADRYGYRLWIDTSTYLLLKSSIIDVNGEVLEQMLFTSLGLPKQIPEALLKPSISGKGYRWFVNEAQQSAANTDPKALLPQWQVGWLPPGFSIRQNQVHEMDMNNKRLVSHMLLSDGLATVSIFIEKFDGKHEPLSGLSSFGAINTYSATANDHLITVMGEIPEATIQKIAASVAPGGTPLTPAAQ
jgi:sigma-E factor negative regulatory protein RseB